MQQFRMHQAMTEPATEARASTADDPRQQRRIARRVMSAAGHRYSLLTSGFPLVTEDKSPAMAEASSAAVLPVHHSGNDSSPHNRRRWRGSPRPALGKPSVVRKETRSRYLSTSSVVRERVSREDRLSLELSSHLEHGLSSRLKHQLSSGSGPVSSAC